MPLTILEGSTFCICDELGDVGDTTSGFFAEDLRFLSVLRLTIDGGRPLLLSSDRVEYFSAAFFLRNAPGPSMAQDTLSIMRRRFVGEAMQEHVVVQNQTSSPAAFELALEVGSDFADIFAVKAHDFALGDPLGAPPLPPLVEPGFDAENNQFLLEDPEDVARTQVILSKAGRVEGPRVVYEVELEPRQRWELFVDVVPVQDGNVVMPKVAERRFGEELVHIRDSLTAWQLRVPQLKADWDALEHAVGQSVADLAALRIRSAGNSGLGRLPAAGMPWFMTVFGRDTLITGLQTLLLGPELARGALEALAELQARDDDPDIDAEPGKIVHEVRHGKAARAWFERYYGAVDATPLYLILLSEVWRWTDDAVFARDLREPALAALEWIERYGDRDGDGFVEYPEAWAARARQPVLEGLGGFAALRGRPVGRGPDRTVRSPGLRLRRQATHGRDGAGGVARSQAGRASGARCGGAAPRLRRRLLGGGARRLLRTGPGRREAPRRRDVLEHRPPALERHRPRRARGSDRRRAHERLPLVRVGCADHVSGGRRLQPALVPQRHGLAARQLPDRLGAGAVRALARSLAHRPTHALGLDLFPPPAAGGLRGPAAIRDALSPSPTPQLRGLRPGLPEPRFSCCRSCWDSGPTAAATRWKALHRRSSRPGPALCASRACRRSIASGTSGSKRARSRWSWHDHSRPWTPSAQARQSRPAGGRRRWRQDLRSSPLRDLGILSGAPPSSPWPARRCPGSGRTAQTCGLG